MAVERAQLLTHRATAAHGTIAVHGASGSHGAIKAHGQATLRARSVGDKKSGGARAAMTVGSPTNKGRD